MDISLVIPAYNEQEVIARTAVEAAGALAAFADEYEVLVVDDGSTDGTADAVLGCGNSHVRLLRYHPNRGKGCAVRTGMLKAQGQLVFYTDADLAYGLEILKPMAQKLEEQGDLIIGSRKLNPDGYRDYPPVRLAASKAFSGLSQLASGLPYDTQCGIKGFRRQAAQEIFSRCRTDGFAFDFEVLMLASRLGMEILQQPVSVVNHQASKVHVVRDSLRILRDMLAIRSRLNSTSAGRGDKL